MKLLQSSGLAWACAGLALLGLGAALWGTRLDAAPKEPAAPAERGPDAKHYDEQVRPFLAKYCLECHCGEKPAKKLALDKLTPNFADKETRTKWLRVLRQVKAGDMPPKPEPGEKDNPRQGEKELQALAGWITANVKSGEATARAAQGRVVVRRLNRVEYENTVHDLLGISIDLKAQLPRDGAMDGFDNVGSALHTSSFLMEKYLEAADRALEVAIANRPRPATLKKRYLMKDQYYVKRSDEDVYRHIDDTV